MGPVPLPARAEPQQVTDAETAATVREMMETVRSERHRDAGAAERLHRRGKIRNGAEN